LSSDYTPIADYGAIGKLRSVPKTGEFPRQFPQAFTHTGFVNAAVYLSHAQGGRPAARAPMGTEEHRQEAGHA